MIIKLQVHSMDSITAKKDQKVYPIVVGFEAAPSKLQCFIKWFLPVGRSAPKPGETVTLDVTDIDSDDSGKLTIRANEIK